MTNAKTLRLLNVDENELQVVLVAFLLGFRPLVALPLILALTNWTELQLESVSTAVRVLHNINDCKRKDCFLIIGKCRANSSKTLAILVCKNGQTQSFLIVVLFFFCTRYSFLSLFCFWVFWFDDFRFPADSFNLPCTDLSFHKPSNWCVFVFPGFVWWRNCVGVVNRRFSKLYFGSQLYFDLFAIPKLSVDFLRSLHFTSVCIQIWKF